MRCTGLCADQTTVTVAGGHGILKLGWWVIGHLADGVHRGNWLGRRLSAPANAGPTGGAASGSGADPAQSDGKPSETTGGGVLGGLSDVLFGKTGPRGGHHDGLATNMARSAVRTMGSAVGREIIRGVLGSIFGKRK